VQRIDERGVGTFHVISMTSTHPVEYTWPYALPGDSVVVTTTRVTRGPTQVHLMSADATTGQAQAILGDSSATYVIGGVNLGGNASVNWRVLANGAIVWFSERDGFGHLYRFNADGTMRNQVTSGPWTVSQLLGVDAKLGRVYVTAKGREKGRHPDYNHVYSVALDGTGMTLLSPEPAEHLVTEVPSGRYFIDTCSTVSTPPVTVLRNVTGGAPVELDRADISDLLATGWRPGEVFMAKARDGVADV
jgi:hypothetical protein